MTIIEPYNTHAEDSGTKRSTPHADDAPPALRIVLPGSGTPVDNVPMAPLLDWLGARPSERRLLLGHNLHSVYLCERNEVFRSMYMAADVVIADGFPVWVAAKRRMDRSGRQQAERLGSTDWLARLNELGGSRRVAVIGADPDSNSEAIRRLSKKFPMHVFHGWDGFTGRDTVERDDFRELRDFGPDLVLVGLGMPTQEEWLKRHWESLPPATYAAIGGAIDQLSGNQSLAPRWLGPLGLEWLWRLAANPRRLARRYLVEPFVLAVLLTKKRRTRRRSHAG